MPGSVSPKPKHGRLPSHYSSGSAHHAPAFPLSHASIPRPIRKPRKILYLCVVFFALYWFGLRHGLGVERVPPPPLGFYSKGGRPGRKSSLAFAGNGIASLQTPAAAGTPEHPIYELMERGEERWLDLVNHQSKTLLQAVDEYKKRYRIPPPAGFDEWFAFCQANGVTIVDEYDQMMKDILPHHALDPRTYIKRSDELEGQEFTYTLDIQPSDIRLWGDRADASRPKQLEQLVRGFHPYLPAGFRLKVTGSDHDTGSVVLGHDQRERAMQLVREGKYFDELELKLLEDPNRTKAWGWFKACPMDSPANIRPGSENATDEVLAKSFIADHLPTMDFCEFPELKRLHGAMSLDYVDRSPSKLKPILVLSKFPGDASHQTTPLQAYWNITKEDGESKWSDKSDHRIFWRGSTTGGFNVQRDWRESHRMRMHLMVNGPKGGDAAWEAQAREVMMPDGIGGYQTVLRSDRVLGEAYADTKLAGGPSQCPTEALCREIEETIEFGDYVSPGDAKGYRYVLDLDGNGWSSRFHRLLVSGSTVVKATMFPEWNMEWLVPWYHYIPLKPDYSDLYDIMAFYVGPVDEWGHVDISKGHDYLGRKIGEAGQRFAAEHWTWGSMQAYMFRLLLEIRRLQSVDREAMSYGGCGEDDGLCMA